MKKYTVIAVLVAILALAVPALAANPFVDVPLNHWAYDAVSKLSAAGIIVGYPDGTFQGTKPITRYEMAMVIARALAKVDETKASKEDLALLKKLVVEFKDELNALGVKLDKIDKRLAAVEKNLNNFRFSGELRVDFVWNSGDYYSAKGDNDQDAFINRARLWVRKQVDDNVGVNFRLDGHGAGTVSMLRAWADIKFPWDIMVMIGKNHYDWEGILGLYADNDAIISGRLWDPVVMLTKDFGVGKFMAYYAYDDATFRVGTTDYSRETAEYGARVDFNFNDKLRIGLFFVGWNVNSPYPGFANVSDPYLYGADLTVNLAKGFRLYGQYIYESTLEDENPVIYKVGLSIDQSVLGFTSIVAEYFHADQFAFANTRIYGAPRGAGHDAGGVGVYEQDFLRYKAIVSPVGTGVIWNRGLEDDVDILFLRFMQKWSDKVTTIQRYYNVKYDDDVDCVAYSLALRYQYTPSTCFEFIYSNANWDGSGMFDESHFRFRTYISF